MKQLLFCILLLSLIGCNETQAPKPKDLIPQDKMIEVLVDIHVADAVVEHKYGADHPNPALTSALYKKIYINHGITAEQYKTSYKYYEMEPDMMNKMYDKVITEISKKEADMGK